MNDCRVTSPNTPENADKLLLNYSVARNQDQIVTFGGSAVSQGCEPELGKRVPCSSSNRNPMKSPISHSKGEDTIKLLLARDMFLSS